MRGAAVSVALSVVLAAVSARTARGADLEPRQLTHDAASNAMPAWSPDAIHIVFHSLRNERQRSGQLPAREIWIMDRDGKGAHKLIGGPKDNYHPSFSPDGKKIVFVSELNGSRDIWVAAADGSGAVPLTDDPGTEDQPAWSPDGRRIAYAAFPREGGSFDLWIMNADGSGKRRLTVTPANEIFPAWHPSGEAIAYVTDVNGNFDIYRIDVSTGRTAPLVATPDQEVRPAWSPDGTKLAFARWPARGRSRDATLWVANSDGTVPVELAAPAPAMHPAWSPDGRTLAFEHRGAAGGWDIWTLTLPPEIARAGRLRLAQQLRAGRNVDAVKLRTGEVLEGAVEASSFSIRTAYASITLPRGAIASIFFEGAPRGLARVVLANGDTLSGFLLAERVTLRTARRERTLYLDQIEHLGLRAGGERPHGPPAFRLLMRNGDALTVTAALAPLRLRVAGRAMEIEPRRIASVDLFPSGEKATVSLRSGDQVRGRVEAAEITARLVLGPRIWLRPTQIQSIVAVGGQAPRHKKP